MEKNKIRTEINVQEETNFNIKENLVSRRAHGIKCKYNVSAFCF